MTTKSKKKFNVTTVSVVIVSEEDEPIDDIYVDEVIADSLSTVGVAYVKDFSNKSFTADSVAKMLVERGLNDEVESLGIDVDGNDLK